MLLAANCVLQLNGDATRWSVHDPGMSVQEAYNTLSSYKVYLQQLSLSSFIFTQSLQLWNTFPFYSLPASSQSVLLNPIGIIHMIKALKHQFFCIPLKGTNRITCFKLFPGYTMNISKGLTNVPPPIIMISCSDKKIFVLIRGNFFLPFLHLTKCILWKVTWSWLLFGTSCSLQVL